ncbi:hypothetical protein GQ600_23688 [Phytophthora cactorum]|nr:hypothetical protein GQ600_23688 [Phytophthora cactorum]
MPRPAIAEKAHFEKRKDIPKNDSGCCFYKCKHCRLVYNKDPDLDPPELLLGRAYNYKNHLAKCEAYTATMARSLCNRATDLIRTAKRLSDQSVRKLIDRTDEERRTAEADRYLACGDTSENEAQLRVETSKIPARIASSTQLGKFAVYYFRRLISDDFGAIRGDMMKWISNKLTSKHVSEFDFDVVRFWQHLEKNAHQAY